VDTQPAQLQHTSGSTGRACDNPLSNNDTMDYCSYRQQWIVLQEDLWEACTRSYPLKTSPLQIRPVRSQDDILIAHQSESLNPNLQVVIFVLAAWLVILGVLGMAPIPEVPINDKVLHFFGVSRYLAAGLSDQRHTDPILTLPDGYRYIPTILRYSRARVSGVVRTLTSSIVASV
jgi:hypothetical protein